MRKRLVLTGAAGLLLVGVLVLSLVAIPGFRGAMSGAKPAVMEAQDTDDFTGAYAGKNIDDLIAKLPADEQKMARSAFEKNEYINIFDGEGMTVLVQVGSIRLHPDPAADRDFVEGRTDRPDPLKDQAYWDYVESGSSGDVPVVGANNGQVEVAE